MSMINTTEQLLNSITNNPKAQLELRMIGCIPGWESLWETLLWCVREYPRNAPNAVNQLQAFQLEADYTVKQILDELPPSVTAQLK